MIAARLSPGAISESSSSHLPASEGSKPPNPVMFPPGWLSRGTMLLATGSLTLAKTIGILVSRWRARSESDGYRDSRMVRLVLWLAHCCENLRFETTRFIIFFLTVIRGEGISFAAPDHPPGRH